MKKLLAVVSTGLVIAGLAVTSFATGKIKESPDIKIAIDGKIGAYTDVPILQDGRTLLPLRAVLTNLGIQNDDSHIVWNAQESSITINNDSSDSETKKIFLQVGNNKAQIDEKTIDLDVPPVIYKSRTYIPARFVAESLGKKVVWNANTRSVLIKNNKSYDEVKDILDKCDAAMKNVNKAKAKVSVDVNSKGKTSMTAKADINLEMDIPKKKMHMLLNMSMLGMNINLESYYDNNVSYTKGFMIDGWSKSALTADELSKEIGSLSLLKSDDSTNAGLVVGDSDKPDEIVLQGALYLDNFSESAMGELGKGLTEGNSELLDNYSIKFIIDKNTYYIKSCTMETKGKASESDSTVTEEKFIIDISDINGNFEVNVPDDVKKSAVESKEANSLF
ncbi:MAG: copper amine oxidase N-terminal domain-containing protein [Bacillota bacterium]|nr:copper amine oxidase N-terminal domain-containing protein [Bacillota bacterium]